MRIGYFVAKFPYSEQYENYSYGGATIAAFHLAVEMARRGHDLRLFTTSRDSNNSVERYENITIFRYGTNLRLLTSNLSIRLFTVPGRYEIDLLHTHFDIAPSPLAGLLYARRRNVPLVVTYHGDWVDNYGDAIRRTGVKIANRIIVNRLLSEARTVISPSERYISTSKFLGKFRDKVSVIPNGVDTTSYEKTGSKNDCRTALGLPLRAKIVLFFGYLSPYKDPGLLIKALPTILREEPDAWLVFAGKGVMRQELQRLSIQLGVDGRVLFTGFVADHLKPLFFKASDVFCLPSASGTECYPLSILEAMASGIPIVASKVGGIPDLITHNREGLLINPGDDKGLADAVLKILCDEEACRRISASASVAIREYTWSRIAEMTERVYEKIAG